MTETVYKLRHVYDVTIIELLNEVDSGASLKILIELSEGLMEKGKNKLIMDLRNVTFIDSSAVGWFIRLKKQTSQIGGDLKLLSPPEFILRLLNVLHLEKLLEIYNTEDEALMSFKKKCESCGGSIDTSDTFCRFCGNKA